jgi:hypothetical protein
MSHVYTIGGYTTAGEYKEYLLQMKAARESERDENNRRKARLRASDFTVDPDRDREGHSESEANSENEAGFEEETDPGSTGGSLGSYA